MPSSSPASWSHYRNGAVYLNNVGCALLEQGAYENAMDTFRDAVSIIKTVCVASTTMEEENSQTKAPLQQSIASSLRLPERMQRANQRLAFPQRCQVVAQEPPLCFDAPPPAMGFLALEDYRYFEFEAHLFQHPYHTLLCPIRMEDSTAINSDLDSGTMLYNLALSYTCLAKCQALSANRDQLNQAAARLYKLADSILQHCVAASKDDMMCDSCAASDNNEDQYMQQYVASVNIAVLHSLLQLMVATTEYLQQEDAFEQVLDRLYVLQHTAYTLNDMKDWCCVEHLPAAAA